MPESDNRPLKIFLCHASADKPIVRKIYSYLRSQGMDPWLDSEKLQPGQNWQREIPIALYSSDVIIVFLSSKSITKEGYVQREIKFALDKALDIPDGEIFLIPARLEEVEIPESLRSYQWVDLFQKKKWKKRLMLSLNKRAVDLGLKPLLIPSETQPPVVNSSAQGKEEISVKFSSSKTKDSSSEAKPPTAKLTSYKPTQDQGASSSNQGTVEKLDSQELPSVVHPKKYEFNLPTRNVSMI